MPEKTKKKSTNGINYDGRTFIGHWAGSSSLPIKVSQSFTAEENSAIRSMGAQWNQATSARTFFAFVGSTSEKAGNSADDYLDDNEFGIYKSSSWLSGYDTATIAITQYAGRQDGDDVILEKADIIINARDYRFDGSSGSIDLPSVIIHEMGHFIGLDHQMDPSIGAVMRPTIKRGETRNSLTDDDRDAVHSLYDKWSYSKALSIEDDENNRYSSNKMKTGAIITGVIEIRIDGTSIHRENGKIIKIVAGHSFINP
jgi:hypothetical protein